MQWQACACADAALATAMAGSLQASAAACTSAQLAAATCSALSKCVCVRSLMWWGLWLYFWGGVLFCMTGIFYVTPIMCVCVHLRT